MKNDNLAPRKTRRRLAEPPTDAVLNRQLRQIIQARRMTSYSLAKLAKVDAAVIQRFRSGGDILLSTASKIAAALGLGLVELARRGRPPGKASAPPDAAVAASESAHE